MVCALPASVAASVRSASSRHPRTSGLCLFGAGVFAARFGTTGCVVVAGASTLLAFTLSRGRGVFAAPLVVIACSLPSVGLVAGGLSLRYLPAADGGVWQTGGGTAGRGGGLIGEARDRAARSLDPGLPRPVAALLRGMALGDDSALSGSVREDFRRSSLTHVTAASGQNVALMLALALPLLTALGLRFRTRLLLCALLAAVYVPLAGGESPIRRAFAMALVALVGRARGAATGVLHPLALAFVLTILIDPGAPDSLGWQLSFAAVAGMASLGPPIAARLQRGGLPPILALPIAVTASACLATAPPIAAAVGRVSLVALPANLIAEPAVALAMLLSLAASAVGQISPGLAAPIAWAAALPAAAVLETARLMAAPSWATVGWTPGSALSWGLVAAVISGGLLLRTVGEGRSRGDHWILRSRRRAAFLALAAIATAVSAFAVDGIGAPDRHAVGAGPRAIFLSVGQGDAELLADGREGVLIDTGPPGTAIASLVRSAGVDHLRGLVLTHGQADHVGALDDLLDAFHPAVVLDGTVAAVGKSTPIVQGLLASAGVRRVVPSVGTTIATGALRVSVLSIGQGGDPNSSSLVALGRAGGLTVLLTADSESPTLAGLDLPTVDVLKLPHHGSSDPGLGAVLDRVEPRLTVIETGPNPYGHPTASAVGAARSFGEVLRTDRDGTVVVRIGRNGLLEHARLETG